MLTIDAIMHKKLQEYQSNGIEIDIPFQSHIVYTDVLLGV